MAEYGKLGVTVICPIEGGYSARHWIHVYEV